VPNDVSTVYDFAQELLALIASALATTDAGAPATQYVAPELPSIDCCPAIIVAASSIAMENTAPNSPPAQVGHRTQVGWINLLTLAAWTVRCTPQPVAGQLPNTTEMNAASLQIHQDLWATWNFITTAARQGSLFEGRCQAIYVDPPNPLNDAGGCGGWVWQVRTAIEGYTVSP